jgi:hypothetical protein
LAATKHFGVNIVKRLAATKCFGMNVSECMMATRCFGASITKCLATTKHFGGSTTKHLAATKRFGVSVSESMTANKHPLDVLVRVLPNARGPPKNYQFFYCERLTYNCYNIGVVLIYFIFHLLDSFANRITIFSIIVFFNY